MYNVVFAAHMQEEYVKHAVMPMRKNATRHIIRHIKKKDEERLEIEKGMLV